LFPPPHPPPHPFLEADFRLDNADLKLLLESLHVALPITVAGDVSLHARVGIPINTPDDRRAYRARATLLPSNVLLAGVELQQVAGRLTFAGGVVDIVDLHGRVPVPRTPAAGPPACGEFEGCARVQVEPPGACTGSLNLDRVPVAPFLSVLGGAPWSGTDACSGQIEARVPLMRLHDVAAWDAGAALSSDRIHIPQLSVAPLRTVRVDCELEEGTLRLSRLRALLAGTPLVGTGNLKLVDALPFEGQVQARGDDLAGLLKLSIPVSGRFQATAALRGTLQPLTWNADGSASGEQLRTLGLCVDQLRFRWHGDAERFRFEEIRAALYRGTATGEALLPLAGDEPANLDLQARDLDLGTLAASIGELPVRLTGRADSSLRVVFHDRVPDAQLELGTARLRVNDFSAERVQTVLRYHREQLDYQAQADLLGGRLRLNGQSPVAAGPQGQAGGQLRIEKVQLTRLWEGLGLQAALRPLSGLLDAEMAFQHDALSASRTLEGLDLSATGRVLLGQLRWEGTDIADGLRGELRWNGSEVRLRELSGTLGEGLLRGQALWNVRQPERSWFTLALDRVEARRLLAPWSGVASHVEGPLEIRLNGTLGREWRGSGQAALQRGKLLGVEVQEWRLPVSFAFSPGREQLTLDVRDSTAQVALGRASLQGKVGWGSGLHLQGQARFTGIDLSTLLGQVAADLGPAASGRASGRIDFSGSNIRSADDLTASCDATFQQTQALQLPVLRQLTPYLAPGQGDTTFKSGDLRANLARGVVRIHRLALPGSVVQLFLTGTVTLQGRLRLEATAQTGFLREATVRALRALRIPASGPIPNALFQQANRVLSVQLIHLHINGNYRNPSIQLEPLSPLTEDALRFFLDAAR
jgi:hypothetical protein